MKLSLQNENELVVDATAVTANGKWKFGCNSVEICGTDIYEMMQNIAEKTAKSILDKAFQGNAIHKGSNPHTAI